MANTSSAKKMVRKIERKTAVNKSRRSRIRTFLRQLDEAIASGEQAKANDAFKVAQSELHRAVGRNIMHKNTVARKLSRLSIQVKAIAS